MKTSKYGMWTLAVSVSLLALAASKMAKADDLIEAGALDQALDTQEVMALDGPSPLLPTDKDLLICYAKNRSGEIFQDRGFRAFPTQRRALVKCNVHSLYACKALGCKRIETQE